LLVGIVALPLLVTAPGWIIDVSPGGVASIVKPAVAFGYWPTVATLCTVLLAALYHVAVPVRGPWRRDLPGAVAAMLLWLASSFLLRTYLAFAIAHSPTYGALSAPIAALLFLYVTSLAVLIGAELNAEIDRDRIRRDTRAALRGEAAAAPLGAPGQTAPPGQSAIPPLGPAEDRATHVRALTDPRRGAPGHPSRQERAAEDQA
ncbi:MAG: YihY/virulence factor BrkB family protein, partial [Actinobacteria bacterium]|nr:YihY/virulence factor BrkB family protein [Actinomycetota bacterium]